MQYPALRNRLEYTPPEISSNVNCPVMWHDSAHHLCLLTLSHHLLSTSYNNFCNLASCCSRAWYRQEKELMENVWVHGLWQLLWGNCGRVAHSGSKTSSCMVCWNGLRELSTVQNSFADFIHSHSLPASYWNRPISTLMFTAATVVIVVLPPSHPPQHSHTCSSSLSWPNKFM